jgi:hypothetical protein
VLSHPLIANSNSNNSGSPVSHESFSTGVEDRLAAHDLGSSTVDLQKLALILNRTGGNPY